jgi:hypothetical protein
MPRVDFPVSSSVFSVVVDQLGAHRNPVPCVLAGRAGTISVVTATERVTDVLTKIVQGWPTSRLDELMPWAYV